MSTDHPASLRRLLSPKDEADREQGWSEFLDEHNKLILHTARRAASGHDEVMDRYAFVLDRLRERDFHRLRSFSANGTGKFSTWLVVIVRRLCVDHHRHVFGRSQGRTDSENTDEQEARRNLAGLLAGDVDPDQIPDELAKSPEAELLGRERIGQLSAVLAELDTRDQLLLTLRYVDGHSPDKLARMLNYPSRFAVYRQLKSLTALLRSRLRARGIDQ